MDCDLPMQCQESHCASTDNTLLPNSPYSKLTPQQQLGISSPADHTHRLDVSQGYPRSNNIQAGAVITKIEDIFESLLDCIINEKKCLALHLKSRGRYGRQTLDANTGAIRNKSNAEAKEITFPGKTQKDAWKFGEHFQDSKMVELNSWLDFLAALLRILELSHEALVTGIVTTKR